MWTIQCVFVSGADAIYLLFWVVYADMVNVFCVDRVFGSHRVMHFLLPKISCC